MRLKMERYKYPAYIVNGKVYVKNNSENKLSWIENK